MVSVQIIGLNEQGSLKKKCFNKCLIFSIFSSAF